MTDLTNKPLHVRIGVGLAGSAVCLMITPFIFGLMILMAVACPFIAVFKPESFKCDKGNVSIGGKENTQS